MHVSVVNQRQPLFKKDLHVPFSFPRTSETRCLDHRCVSTSLTRDQTMSHKILESIKATIYKQEHHTVF